MEKNDLVREVIILRGMPGSGKTELARSFAARYDAVICSADDFFVVNGKYRFNGALLPDAHAFCRAKAQTAICEGRERVIIDNCNYNPEHFRFYEQIARDYGYKVVHLLVEKRHNGKSEHFVPLHTIERNREILRGSIALHSG